MIEWETDNYYIVVYDDRSGHGYSWQFTIFDENKERTVYGGSATSAESAIRTARMFAGEEPK